MFDEAFLRKLELLRLAVKKLATVNREGDRPVRRAGPSSDFLSHRNYAQGDEFRYIDWAAYARLEEIFVKQFAREEAFSLELVLDTSGSMRFGTPSKLALALQLAQAFGYVTLANRGRVSIHTPDAGALKTRSFDGQPTTMDLLRYTEMLPSGSPLNLSTVLKYLQPAPGRRPFVVILSDLWMPIEDSDLRSLRARFGQSALIQILSREELEPAAQGKFKIVDSETGETREMYLDTEGLKMYVERLNDHLRGLETRLEENELAYVRLRSDAPLEKAFFVTIRQAGLVT
jgi:uncharacterized protein (DUF58 family)